ncbi:MAG: tyrosine-type recombinase/integrase [Acidithiobacillus sp.]
MAIVPIYSKSKTELAKPKEKRKKTWQVQIRKDGYPPYIETFKKKAEAEIDEARVLTEMARGMFVDRSEAESMTVAVMLERYNAEVSPKHKSGDRDIVPIRALTKSLGQYSLAALTPSIIAKYRDTRLAHVSERTRRPLSAQTVKHELGMLERAIKHAAMEWGVHLPRGVPTLLVKKPKVDNARNRRLSPEDLDRLMSACASSRNKLVLPAIQLALATTARIGSLLALKWSDVDIEGQVATLRDTKTMKIHIIPLTKEAIAILEKLPRSKSGRVLGTTYMAIHKVFERASLSEGIDDFRFHDLRHEGTSRLFEKGLNTMQASVVTGHKTLGMLNRYTHLRPKDIADLLDKE